MIVGDRRHEVTGRSTVTIVYQSTLGLLHQSSSSSVSMLIINYVLISHAKVYKQNFVGIRQCDDRTFFDIINSKNKR